MGLKSLTYTSWAKADIAPGNIEAILSRSLADNRERAVTGLLIFNGTNFLQILEGSSQDIDNLMEAIGSDRRHSNITVRDERAIERRSFADWAMAYLGLEDGSFVGEGAVKKALELDLPPTLRNIVLGVIYPVTRA